MKINSPKEMFELGEKMAKETKIVLLNWELWAGKTLFTQGFAQWLGIDKEIVKSPTYTYINIYDDKLLHIDMYRLDELDHAVEKWIIDHIWDFDYVIIEWPKFDEHLPIHDYTSIHIEKTWDTTREIKIITPH